MTTTSTPERPAAEVAFEGIATAIAALGQNPSNVTAAYFSAPNGFAVASRNADASVTTRTHDFNLPMGIRQAIIAEVLGKTEATL